MRQITITYRREDFKLWRRGRLHCEWFSRYRGLFDCDDLRLVCNQHRDGYHFGEWCAAIHYWKRGFRVLQPKYHRPLHRTKHRKALGALGKKKLEWLSSWKRGRPDLLVFKRRSAFFVEVKRERDRLSKAQIECFGQIEKELGMDVVVAHVEART